jgi:septum formation protein
LILASGSPQRRAILEQLGISFEVMAPEVEELVSGPPQEIAVENAFRKASSVSAAGAVVLGVDTVVALGQQSYGKPASIDDARATLCALSGRRHLVIGGVCLLVPGRRAVVSAATTTVEFRVLDERLIRWYLNTGEWEGRAGAYAIQGHGAALVRVIEGDYYNVVGLPVALLLDLAPELLA